MLTAIEGAAVEIHYLDLLSQLETIHGVPRSAVLILDELVGQRMAYVQDLSAVAVDDMVVACRTFLAGLGYP